MYTRSYRYCKFSLTPPLCHVPSLLNEPVLGVFAWTLPLGFRHSVTDVKNIQLLGKRLLVTTLEVGCAFMCVYCARVTKVSQLPGAG